MYVIQRTDQGGGYVTPAGNHPTYTHDLTKASIFATQEAADKDRCKGNEIVVPLTSILNKPTH